MLTCTVGLPEGLRVEGSNGTPELAFCPTYQHLLSQKAATAYPSHCGGFSLPVPSSSLLFPAGGTNVLSNLAFFSVLPLVPSTQASCCPPTKLCECLSFSLPLRPYSCHLMTLGLAPIRALTTRGPNSSSCLPPESSSLFT